MTEPESQIAETGIPEVSWAEALAHVDNQGPFQNREQGRVRSGPGISESLGTSEGDEPDDITAEEQPPHSYIGGMIVAHFTKGRSVVEVRPPRTERERRLTEQIVDPESGREVDFSHSVKNDEVEVIVIKRKYLGDPEHTPKSARRERFLTAVNIFAGILDNREFDGNLHEDENKQHKGKKHKKT